MVGFAYTICSSANVSVGPIEHTQTGPTEFPIATGSPPTLGIALGDHAVDIASGVKWARRSDSNAQVRMSVIFYDWNIGEGQGLTRG